MHSTILNMFSGTTPVGAIALSGKFLLLLCISLLAGGCFEPEEGCSDIAATNFNASADKDCDNCCTYPKLQLEVTQQYDTLTFLENRFYPISATDSFFLKSVSFYLSNFKLFQNGETFTVSDTVGLRTFASTGSDTLRKIFTDDFILVRRTPLISEAGSFRQDGVFDGVEFRLGIADSAQQVVPSLAPAGHPLRTQSDSLWHGRSEGFVFLQVIAARDTLNGAPPDTISLTRADLPDFRLLANGVFTHETGYNFTLKLRVDYKVLLSGIDWTTGDISAWKSTIVANLSNAFSVSQ